MSRTRPDHLAPLTCDAEDCEKVFQPWSRTQRFCSPECREVERSREKRALRGPGDPRPAKHFTADALAAVMSQLQPCGKVRLA